jgi:hypothetical protein
MSMDIKPVKVEDIRCVVEECTNIVAFMNAAIVSICQGDSGPLGEDQLMGMQNILFGIEEKMRGVGNCLDENPQLLKPLLGKNPATSKKAI